MLYRNVKEWSFIKMRTYSYASKHFLKIIFKFFRKGCSTVMQKNEVLLREPTAMKLKI